MEEITGHIERITFQNSENGFTVARMKVPGKRDLTVVVGTMTTVQVGETVKCKGQWKNDVNHGIQFQVVEYHVEQPSSIYGIKKYLGSGLIKGIGNAFAERIVDYLGKQTLDVIDSRPEALLEVDGIGPKRMESIKKCWDEQKAVRELMVFLQGYGISPTYAQKVYRTYGDESLAVIQENPYQLARDIWGIGFKTADQTARKLGMDQNAPARIDAGMEYVLSELANEGHTCYPVDQFLEAAQKLLEVEANLIANRLEAVAAENRIFIGPLLVEEKPTACVWLQVFRTCEEGIARELTRLEDHSLFTNLIQSETSVPWAEKTLNIQLAVQQKEAVERSLSTKVHILTGGPGTGKSTITKVILLISHQHTKKILLAAPTGRAAKRLSEITKMEASTIHSLLEFDFGINGFRRNRDNPLDCDLLIVDEASMIDTVLMYSLLKAIPTHARLLLVGDVDQLPSVGAGSVLQDLINSGRIGVSRLTEIFRQAAGSAIITNAHAINSGRLPDLRIRKDSDFFFIRETDLEKMAATILELVKTRLPGRYKFDPFHDIQVISPMNRGVIGTRALNEKLQETLNPSTEPLLKGGRRFHLHDKVMQLRNNYDKEVFNGDIGRITKIDRIEQEVTVDFDGKLVLYDFADVDQLMLAYAVSVHKYQGSECPCIIMPVHTTHYLILSRNLLYTGITRGKRLVIIIGTQQALGIAVRNDKATRRYTGLMEAVKG